MVGKTLEELGFTREIIPTHFSVKEAVFPFVKFPGVDTLLGPEMKSTGEVMGLDSDFGRAFAKAQIEAGNSLPSTGSVLVSVRTDHHAEIVEPVRILVESGFSVVATKGTAETLARHGIHAKVVKKTYEGSWHTVDEMEDGGVDLVFHTVAPDPRAIQDSFAMRRVALQRQIPYCTTLPAARASAAAIAAIGQKSIGVRALQTIHAHGAEA
jgi:carbamoyl-phosphate synthase large subunit